MIHPISSALSAPAAKPTEASSPAVSAEQAKLTKVAQDFEQIFVRQLLATAKFGQSGKESGYSGMIVEALSSGISAGGGLGLAKDIADSLTKMAGTAKGVP